MKSSMLFFHDVRSGYPKGVLDGIAGVPEYTARALASTDGTRGDVIIVPHQVIPHLNWIKDHYQRVGLNVSQTIVAGDWDVVGRIPNHELSVFIFTEESHGVEPDEPRLVAVKRHNDKNYFIGQICTVLKVPTPQTVCFDGPSEVPEAPLPYPFYVKAAVSASGRRVNRCCNDDELRRALAEVDGEPLQIQEELPEETLFLNVQYRNEGGHAVRGPVTRQILNGNSHDGNINPSGVDEVSVWRVTDPLADFGVESGLKEVWAYDVAYLPDGRVQVIECNPRFNGCTYFSNVAARLNVNSWMARNVAFLPGSFENISLDDLEFADGRGIIIVNWGCTHHRKLGLFIAGTESEQEYFLRMFDARFNRRPQIRAVS